MNQEALLEKHYLCVVLHSAINPGKEKKKKVADNNFYLMSISHNDNDGGSGGAMGNLSKKLGGSSNKQA